MEIHVFILFVFSGQELVDAYSDYRLIGILIVGNIQLAVWIKLLIVVILRREKEMVCANFGTMLTLQLAARHYQLTFRHAFGIAHGTRSFTDTIYVRTSFLDQHGYGEAALPPYLGYDASKLVMDFHSWFPREMESGDAIREALSKLSLQGSLVPKPLRTAVDIALYDLFGKLTGKSVRTIFGITGNVQPKCSFTLGISSIDEMMQKVEEAGDFELFKLKLGGPGDKERVEAFLSSGHSMFCVDANQAWKSLEEALGWMRWLADKGCLFVEQPLPVSMSTMYESLFKQSPLPLILDESIQGIREIQELRSVCHGVNVKLVKAGGLEPAVAMVREANKLGLKVLVGCMSESTCGAMAAAQLSPWVDWVDLDGPRLIANDPFEGAVYQSGSLLLPDVSGTGALLRDKVLFGSEA